MIRLSNVSYVYIVVTICIFLHIAGINQCYGDNIKPKKYLKKESTSPEGNIIIRHLGEHPDDFYWDIWLYSRKNPSKKALLFSYERDADVLISSDEKWLVINYRVGTTDTDALLFKKVKDLEYEEIDYLNDKAWNLFRKTHRKYKIPQFGHSYVEAVLWSSDSKSVMLEIYGHDDLSPKRLEPWYCIYDLTAGKMTLDFDRVFNRDTYHPNGEARGRKLYTY
ncbi:MAG: hypothetical protein HQK96_06425 [Nitrospirae bacterium]|nr:hypothetical protein [Nitrospirota bacterium]